MKKDICRIFRDNELRVTIEANKKVVNFLDVNLNLNSGQYLPYMKPNNTQTQVHQHEFESPANHSQEHPSRNKYAPIRIIIKRRNFQQLSPYLPKSAIDNSRFSYKLHYERPSQPKVNKRTRKRNIIWLNPRYDQSVKTNIGSEFLKILDKCFPATNKLNKIFNHNTVKLSYSCMPNVKTTIEGNNKKILRNSKSMAKTERKCNCPKNVECPLNSKCLSKDIVYRATVTSESSKETYVGLIATTFKARLANHKASFRTETKRNATELSKHIWTLKDNNLDYTINWDILCHASHYSNTSKRSNLCIAEKFYILCKLECATLNKRNKLVSKCRHREKFLLRNIK